MFWGDAPLATLVQMTNGSRLPRLLNQRPRIFSDEFISVVASRVSSTPYIAIRPCLAFPPPYASEESKKVTPFSAAWSRTRKESSSSISRPNVTQPRPMRLIVISVRPMLLCSIAVRLRQG